jgi:hypothetical protein
LASITFTASGVLSTLPTVTVCGVVLGRATISYLGAAATITQLLIAAAPLFEESTALAMKAKDPAALVSVPVIAPVEGLKIKPNGSEPEVMKKL